MKILIIGPSWVGDMVMAQCLFSFIKKQNPNAVIDVLAPAWSRPILERMPQVRESFDMPLGHGALQIGERKKIGHSLRAQKYDQAIVLPNSLKSALIPWFANIPKRTGWRGEMRYGLLNDVRKLDKEKYPYMVQRFVALAQEKNTAALPLKEIPAPQFSVAPQLAQAACKTHGLSIERPILALCPGAEFGPAKQWPAEHYAARAKNAIEQGHNVWIFGSQNDVAAAQEIKQKADVAKKGVGESSAKSDAHCFILAGKTSLAEAVDLMSLASAVVSNDSGLMHIAAALNKPLVGVYGSTSPQFTPPLNSGARIAHTDIACRPCFKRECPLGHLKCLTELHAEKVIQLLGEAMPHTSAEKRLADSASSAGKKA